MSEPGDLDPTLPFTRSEAIAAGIGAKQLLGPGYRRLFRNVYVAASTPATDVQRARGALLSQCDQAWASHVSAARVIGAPVPVIGTEHVSVPHQALRRHRAGVRCHVGDPTGTRVVKGVRVSGRTQMFVELAGQLTLVDLVVVGDWLVRRTSLTPAQLVGACRDSPHKDARKALEAAGYVRARVDSPMETRLRMLLVLAGLPEPQVNLAIRDEDGEPIRQHDLSYPEVRFALEYDGRLHVEIIEQWEKDLERRADMDDDEWRLVVVVSAGIYRHPEQTLRRVWQVLRARGVAGVPLRLSDDWRPHFPGHAGAA